MSIESMVIALHHSRAKGATKLVLLGIANHDGDGGAWPSVQTLQKYAGVSRSNVQAALGRLEEYGEIRRRVGAGGRAETPNYARPNLYEFLLTCPSTCDGTAKHRELSDPALPVGRGPADRAGDALLAGPEPSYNLPTDIEPVKSTHVSSPRESVRQSLNGALLVLTEGDLDKLIDTICAKSKTPVPPSKRYAYAYKALNADDADKWLAVAWNMMLDRDAA